LKKLTVNRPVEQQMKLFEYFKEFDFETVGSLRTHYGRAAEEIACKYLGIHPIPINGNYEVNFDAFKEDDFFEIKNVQKNGKTVLYDFRMEKEKPFLDDLIYIFVIHQVKNAKSNRDLWEQMQSKGLTIFTCQAKFVHEEAFKCPLRTMNLNNKSAGWNRKGYSKGYRNVPIKKLLVGAAEFEQDFLRAYDFMIPINYVVK